MMVGLYLRSHAALLITLIVSRRGVLSRDDGVYQVGRHPRTNNNYRIVLFHISSCDVRGRRRERDSSLNIYTLFPRHCNYIWWAANLSQCVCAYTQL